MAVSVPAGMRQMTSTTCIDCGRLFPVGAGLHLGAVKYAIGTSSAFDELDVVDVDDELLYKPLFFCQTCLDEVIAGLLDILSDQPPLENTASILECDYCGSGILPLEVYTRLQYGKTVISPRRPAGQVLHQFDADGCGNNILCISCMAHISEQVLEIWDTVSQQEECADCQHIRCWREDTCSIECECHDEDEQELFTRGDEVTYTADFLQHVPSSIPTPRRGTVQIDQEHGETDVDVSWSDGTRSRVNQEIIEHAD